KKITTSFLAGFLTVLTPAVHFAAFSYYPALLPLFISAWRRKRLNFVFFGIGALSVLLPVWLPWSRFCLPDAISAAAADSGQLFNSFTGAASVCREFFSTFGESAILRGYPDSDSASFTILGFTKYVFLAVSAVFAMVAWKRGGKSDRLPLAAFLAMFVVLTLNAMYGKTRNDYLLNFSTSFFLVATVAATKWASIFVRLFSIRHRLSERLVNSILLAFTIGTVIIWSHIFEIKYERQTRFRPFEVSDVPLYDKIDLLNKMLETTTLQGARHRTFAIVNKDYPKIFGFILYFKALDIDGLYSEDIFHTTYLNNIQKRDTYRCVHWSYNPDFLIIYTKKSPARIRLRDRNGNMTTYTLIKSGVFQKLYSKRLQDE
ncbi:MAG: hypothetical protein GXP32_08270, partial [Kiritimatiellaeota bacterium]|nr:hypothetical protein [Kiritimatiellota bacterium]